MTASSPSQITVPVLVMHGDDDQIVPYADLSLPRFRGHPNSHESAIGGCHGKAEAEEAAIVLAGVQGGDGPVGAGEREEPRDDRPGARSHRDSAARLGAAG